MIWCKSKDINLRNCFGKLFNDSQEIQGFALTFCFLNSCRYCKCFPVPFSLKKTSKLCSSFFVSLFIIILFAGVPGKIQHNLKINVNALMPGAVPPRKELVKSQSLETTAVDEADSLTSSVSEGALDRSNDDSLLKNRSVTDGDNISFEVLPVQVETLHNITKVSNNAKFKLFSISAF